jgi:asparagine synthase (glutamine-hydrolysing)
MCGIAGIIGRIGDANKAALRRMSDAMAHRGPDGEGTWVSSPDERGTGVLLAHRRLAILDLSPAGAQPMIDPVRGTAIAFNGEVYNYVTLRERLVAEGQRFASTGDTVVVLRKLSLEGPAAVSALRGMFALAYFDPDERTLLLARDPLGMKPLYVARNPDREGGWTLAFASEVRALLASGLIASPRLDPRAVASVAWNGFVTSPATAVAGVESLLPGELRVYDGAGSPQRSEFHWNAAPRGAGTADEAEVASVLREGVRLHLASDVPLGVFLSSGIDSSAVANLAQRAAGRPVHTFTLAFEDPELNEGTHAREIARAIGSDHREILLTESRFVDHLEKALDALDQPTFDGLNSYYVAQAVREAGFKVALVGTGGDELFGGYASFRFLPVLGAWSRRARLLPLGLRVAAARAVATVLAPRGGAVPPQTRWAKLPDLVSRGENVLGLYQLAYALFLPKFQEELLALGEGGGSPDAHLVDGLPACLRERIEAETRGRSFRSALSVAEERLFLGERLLRDSDAASMAVSLELRLPLVDQVLFQAVDRLPDAQRFLPPGRKAMLRRIGLEGLPSVLFERPKRGFVLPFDRWIRRSLGAVMDETLRDPALVAPTGLDPATVRRLGEAFRAGARGMYWSRLWAIYVLVRWCHRHHVYL